MFREFSRVLRAPKDDDGAVGATGSGASGTPPADEPATDPKVEPRSINQQAKELPWVIDALKAQAELSKLKAEKADSKQKAEREKAEAEGRYNDALKMEQEKYKKLEENHKADIRRMSLETAMSHAGIRDLRAVKLFENDYDNEKESMDDFVNRIKADKKNAMYFSDPKQPRTPEDPTPAAGIGSGEKYDPSWINSNDPKKKAAAIKHNRNKFWKKHHGG